MLVRGWFIYQRYAVASKGYYGDLGAYVVLLPYDKTRVMGLR